eukprot:RCo018132
MALADAFSEILERDLSANEREMLQLLSPQGMAKVNEDLSQGVDPEQTLSQLLVVFRATKHRQALARCLLPMALAPMLAKMSRPPTVDELAFLAGACSATLLERQITLRTKKGELVEDVLEELAEQHRQKHLDDEALLLSEEKGMPVTVSPLSPTKLNATDESLLTLSMTEIPGKNGKLRLGPGPLLTWFTLQKAAEDLSESPSLASQDTVPSPRSVLKRVGKESPRSSVGPSCGSSSSLASTPRSVGAGAPEEGPSD